jgi:hypothetical protein
LSNGGYQVEVVEPVGSVLPSLLPERASAKRWRRGWRLVWA